MHVFVMFKYLLMVCGRDIVKSDCASKLPLIQNDSGLNIKGLGERELK